MNHITILDKTIGQHCKPFIIAELSGNHNGKLERALALVDAAKDAGVDAIKLQTYTADTMTLDVDKPEFYVQDPGSLWYKRHLYDLYEEAHTPWEWHKSIMEYAKKIGMICFSTPFDHSAVDFLESLNVPCYKIASFENTDIHLIKKVAETGKPVIISTGMADLAELELITNTLHDSGCDSFILLKCVSAYPAPYADCNLRTIPHLHDMFQCPVGLSDHTIGLAVPIASVAIGACIIEKHFTLSRNDGGVDSSFSLEKEELKMLVKEVDNAWSALGKVCYHPSEKEAKSKAFRRSLYFIKDLEAGQLIKDEHIRSIRPGFGAKPSSMQSILGKRTLIDIQKGSPVNLSKISSE